MSRSPQRHKKQRGVSKPILAYIPYSVLHYYPLSYQ